MLLGRMQIHYSNAYTHSHTCPLNKIHSLLNLKIHIVEEGCAGCQHLLYCPLAPFANICSSEFGLVGPDVFVQPGLQVCIVAITPQQRHCRVVVSVVKRGENCSALKVHNPVFSILRPRGCKSLRSRRCKSLRIGRLQSLRLNRLKCGIGKIAIFKETVGDKDICFVAVKRYVFKYCLHSFAATKLKNYPIGNYKYLSLQKG